MSSSTKSAGTGTDDGSVGSNAWSNPGNITASDNTYAAVTGTFNALSHRLKATNFGFSIPSGATINGILAEIEMVEPSGTTQGTVSAVNIIKGGTVGSQNRASDASTLIDSTEGYKSYGSSTQLWNLSWTDSDINASNFGVALNVRCDRNADGDNSTVQVDHVRITVYYTEAGLSVAVSSIASLEAFGTTKIIQALPVSGIASSEAFGNLSVQRGAISVLPAGIISQAAFGTPKINPQITVVGIASLEVFGSPSLRLKLLPEAIASLEAFGSPTILRGTVIVAPSGIASLEAFGTPVVSGGAVIVTTSAIASLEAFGAAMVNLTVAPSGIASLEVFGSPSLRLKLLPEAIASLEAFGSPTVLRGAVNLLISPTASLEAFGSPTVVRGAVSILPGAIASLEAFGMPTFLRGGVIVAPSGIATAEAFSVLTLQRGAISVLPAGIISQAGFGNPNILRGTVTLTIGGIASLVSFGSAQLNQRIAVNSLASAEAFGTAFVKGLYNLFPENIGSQQAFGSPRLNLVLFPSGIGSLQSFGLFTIDQTTFHIVILTAKGRSRLFTAAGVPDLTAKKRSRNLTGVTQS